MYQIGYSFSAKLAHSGLWRQGCIACISQRGTGRRQRNFKQQFAFISHCEDYPPGSCLACTSGGVAWTNLWFHRFRFVSRALHREMTHRTLVAPGNMFDPFGPWCIAWWTPRNPLRGLWCCCCWWCASWETEHDKQLWISRFWYCNRKPTLHDLLACSPHHSWAPGMYLGSCLQMHASIICENLATISMTMMKQIQEDTLERFLYPVKNQFKLFWDKICLSLEFIFIISSLCPGLIVHLLTLRHPCKHFFVLSRMALIGAKLWTPCSLLVGSGLDCSICILHSLVPWL